jgi:uncharacterized membrane protein
MPNRVILLLCLGIVIANKIAVAQSITGSISGRIVAGERGEPLVDAMVLVEGSSPSSSYRETTTTDDKGYFVVNSLSLGSYVIYPYKVDEMYLIPNNTFVTKNPERADITAQHPAMVVTIHMPPPGSLLVGKVESVDGRPINGAKIVLCHSDEVTRAAEIGSTPPDGEFTYLIPSNTNISILVSAAEYQERQVDDINTSPKESRNVTIKLMPRGGLGSGGGMANPQAQCRLP